MNMKPQISKTTALVPTGGDKALGGGYDAGARMDRQIAGWTPQLNSADVDMLQDKDLIDARARDLGKNDAYVQSGAMIHKDSIVGAFYMLNSKPEAKLLGKSDGWEEDFQEEVESLFTLWAESPQCWPDAERTKDFTSIIRLAVGIYVFGGEYLGTAEYIDQQAREYRTAIQMIDCDRLSTPFDKVNDRSIRGGFRFDRYGAAQSAFIRSQHPSDYRFSLGGYSTPYWREVEMQKPWGRQQVIYIREQIRVDQSRAISELHAGMREVAMTRKFRDITLQKALMAASIAATIESELPAEAVYQQLGAGQGQQSMGEGMVDYAQEYLSAVNEYVGASKNVLWDGVKIPHLFPGTKLQLQNAGDPAGVGQEYEDSLMRYAAAAMNLSSEEYSKNFKDSNYSSIRAAMANTGKFMRARKKIAADAMANQIYRLWLEEAINGDKLSTFRAKEGNRLYSNGRQNMLFEAISRADWIGAALGQIDELKETQAAVLRIKFGLSTHEIELAKQGQDWRKINKQLQRERLDREARGIVLIEDNSVNAASGTPREQENDGTSTEDKKTSGK